MQKTLSEIIYNRKRIRGRHEYSDIHSSFLMWMLILSHDDMNNIREYVEIEKYSASIILKCSVEKFQEIYNYFISLGVIQQIKEDDLFYTIKF